MVDTFYWNQLNELDYTMRRESADNDSLLHLLPSGNYTSSLFENLSPGVAVRPGLRTGSSSSSHPDVKHLPSGVRVAYNIFPSNFWASMIDPDNTQELITCIDAPPINLPPVSTLSDEETSSFGSEDEEEENEDNGWHSLTIGDFVVVLCDLMRVDFMNDHSNGSSERNHVYAIDALSVNIVA
ncbi:hypothetical protein B0H19DRAFT_1068738 [Mycena capillaripes]|nr:hypothetical protein B0H19DRAFT_1068738 [Mycena capillaripes]